jgi:hypothetical protein
MFRALMVLRNRLSPTMNHYSTRVREQRPDNPDPTHCPQLAVRDVAPENGGLAEASRSVPRNSSLVYFAKTSWLPLSLGPKNAHAADLPGFPAFAMDYSP